MTRIGFVGLGRMGAAMAPRLLGPGRTLTVWRSSVAPAAKKLSAPRAYGSSFQVLFTTSSGAGASAPNISRTVVCTRSASTGSGREITPSKGRVRRSAE